MKQALVISHANCTDGTFAAWAAQQHLARWGAKVEVQFSEPDKMPKTNRSEYDIAFVLDMVAPQAALEKLGCPVWVLDHHKSNQDTATTAENVRVFFDMERSGAGLAWDMIPMIIGIPPEPRPWLIDYVEDRDLWAWDLPMSREVNAGISLIKDPNKLAEHARDEVAAWGGLVLQTNQVHVDEVVKNAERVPHLSVPCWIVNSPVLRSEIGDALVQKNNELAVVWWSKEDRAFISFRGPGAMEAAQKLGGGGHPRAAGASVSMSLWMNILGLGE